MTSILDHAALDPARDPAIDRRSRAFLREVNKDSSPFWELPGEEPRTIVTALQARTPVDVSGVEVDTRAITVDGRRITLYVVRPEAYESAVWVTRHGGDLGVDSSRLAVSGNSVGGNMAAAVTLMAHDKGGANIVFQQLLWPALDTDLDTGSYRAYGEGRFLPRAFMEYGWDHYAPDPETRRHRYVAPLQATIEQLRGLPPTLIQTAENDVLRDEGEAYARKLDEAGVDVTCVRYNGAIHDFGLLNALRDVPSTDAALRQAAAELARHLG
jgi:acetyl esterase